MPALDRWGNVHYYPDKDVPALVRYLSTKDVIQSKGEYGYNGDLVPGSGNSLAWIIRMMNETPDRSAAIPTHQVLIPNTVVEGGVQRLKAVQIGDGVPNEAIAVAASTPYYGILMATTFERTLEKEGLAVSAGLKLPTGNIVLGVAFGIGVVALATYGIWHVVNRV